MRYLSSIRMPSSGSFNSLLLPNMAKFMFFVLNILARYPCRQCLEFQSAAVLVGMSKNLRLHSTPLLTTLHAPFRQGKLEDEQTNEGNQNQNIFFFYKRRSQETNVFLLLLFIKGKKQLFATENYKNFSSQSQCIFNFSETNFC